MTVPLFVIDIGAPPKTFAPIANVLPEFTVNAPLTVIFPFAVYANAPLPMVKLL